MERYAVTLEDRPAPQDVRALEAALRAYNAAHIGPTDYTELAVFVRDSGGQVVGGVYGELEWGWMYIDVIWLEAGLRGRGMGTRLMAALEQAARARGVTRVHMTTTSFQALPFYRKLGYEVWGALDDRPPGHRYYYLRKADVTPQTVDSGLVVQENPTPPDRQALIAGLRGHMRENGAPLESRTLAVFIRERDVGLVGGLFGRTYWGWFDLSRLWVAARLRGQGYGARLLALAERECAARGIAHIVTDAASFHTLSFYERHGFETVGKLADRPPGHTSYVLKKQNLTECNEIRAT